MSTKLLHLPPSKLVFYSRKLRKNDHAVGRMIQSIQQFGFKVPILALSSGEVVDGDLRLKAALKLGLDEVPVILCDEWSEAQVKAFRLMVNRSATWADFDLEEVSIEIKELQALNFDLSFTGFQPLELDRLMFGTGPEADQAREISSDSGKAVSRVGDLFQCGDHRVLCGDATSESAVDMLFADAKAVLMVTDPPYGVLYNPMWREHAGLGRQRQVGLVANDNQVDWSSAYSHFHGDVVYVWHAGVHAAEVAANLESVGFRIRAQIIWAKQNFALGRGDYHWKHEPCWYAVREGKSSNWSGDRTQSTVWEVANLNPIGGSSDEPATGHSTQKPIALMRRPILNNTLPGQIVYDPFLGSGTTMIAAESVERICFGLEIEPRYVDVIVRRWQSFTGKSAVHPASGRSFDELAAERTAAVEEV